MRANGSAASGIPASATPLVVAVGVVSMGLVFQATAPLGVRAALALAEPALLAPGLLLAVLLRRTTGLGRGRTDARTVGLALAAGAALWVTSLGLFEVQYVAWAPPPGYLEGFRKLHALLRPHGALDAVFSVAAIALIPALCEELLFRGLVQPPLCRRLGPVVGVLTTAALFGAIHLDRTSGQLSAYRVPFAIVVGIGLGVLRLRAGLLAPVLSHALLNTITFVAAPYADDPTRTTPESRPLLGAALLLGGAAVTSLLLRLVGRASRR